ncbi:hypothetical protein CI102_14203 [Trichoderma harzianum]|nr:hypothetical protein CI102_14203 [Trichoderma harzianum]
MGASGASYRLSPPASAFEVPSEHGPGASSLHLQQPSIATNKPLVDIHQHQHHNSNPYDACPMSHMIPYCILRLISIPIGQSSVPLACFITLPPAAQITNSPPVPIKGGPTSNHDVRGSSPAPFQKKNLARIYGVIPTQSDKTRHFCPRPADETKCSSTFFNSRPAGLYRRPPHWNRQATMPRCKTRIAS